MSEKIRLSSNTKKIIICIDFDNTLFSHPGKKFPQIGKPNIEFIELLIKAREEHPDILRYILWTCREGKDLKLAVKACSAYGLEFDAVNDNLPEIIEKFGFNTRKPYCTLFIDDRNLNIDNLDAIKEFFVNISNH